MTFLKKHWFKILIIIPVVPGLLFLYFLNYFMELDESLHLVVTVVVLSVMVLLLSVGAILENSAKRVAEKDENTAIKKHKIDVVKTFQILVASLAVVFFVFISYAANTTRRVGNVVENIAATPNVTNDQSYSLVVLNDFDVNNQAPHAQVGVLSSDDEAKDLAIEDFLYEQNFVQNPLLQKFASPIDLMNALYGGDVTAVIVVSDYAQIFDSWEEFDTISEDTMILDSFTFVPELTEREAINLGEPFSILFLGLNTRQEVSSGLGQINTFMLLTVNLQELSFTVTSIPRDSYVFVPCRGGYDKLSHTNWGGTHCAVGAIEHLFDMEIPYYVKLNFTGFMEIIDTLGGVMVDIPFRFEEQDSRRRFGEEHLIVLEPGLQLLNAEEALAFSRHRNLRGTSTMRGNDFTRVAHQQIVFQAMLSAMFEQAGSINDILPLLEVVGQHLDTNLNASEIIAISQHLLDLIITTNRSYLMDNLHLMNMVILGDTPRINNLSVVLPWPGMIARARELMMINLGLEDAPFNFDFTFNGFDHEPIQWLRGSGGFGSGRVPPGRQANNQQSNNEGNNVQTPNPEPETPQEPGYTPEPGHTPEPPVELPPVPEPEYNPEPVEPDAPAYQPDNNNDANAN